MQTLLPIAYLLCTQLAVASLVMGIIYGLLWVSHMIQFVSQNEEAGSQEEALAEAIKNFWFELTVMIVCFAGALTAINKVSCTAPHC